MREDRIKAKLQILEPQYIEVHNESHQHSGPREDSHYKVLIVSEGFSGQNRVQRQRMVNQALQEEFNSGMHALSLRCLTPHEAKEQELHFQSPDCASSKPPADS